LALRYDNPIKFLIDHQSCWEESYYSKKEAISYLASKFQNFQESDIMNMLSDILNDDFAVESYVEIAMKGISKALDIPEFKERAIDLLLVAGSQYSQSYNSSWTLLRGKYSFDRTEILKRSSARKILKKVINEDQIRKSFQEMLNTEPIAQLKIELLNILDHFDDISDKLNKNEIIKNLSSSWNFDYFIDDEEHKKSRQIAVQELMQLVQSRMHNRSLKIVAIRYFCNYFISMTEREIRLDKSNNLNDYYYNFAFEQREYRITIYQFLKELVQNQTIDPFIREEASSLLSMIVTHLQKIRFAYHPIFKISWEVYILLESIELGYDRSAITTSEASLPSDACMIS
jgi:hypothetical protein